MSMVTAMDGIGDVNHVDTVHDNTNKEYKKAMEKAMENEKVVAYDSVSELKGSGEVKETLVQQPVPTDIWLQFDTITIGSDPKNLVRFDLKEIFYGLSKLASLTMVKEPVNTDIEFEDEKEVVEKINELEEKEEK